MYWLGTLGLKEQTSGELCVLFYIFLPFIYHGLGTGDAPNPECQWAQTRNAPKKAPLSCQRTKKLVALLDKNILITVIPAQFPVNIMSKATPHPLPNRKWKENY